MLIIDSGRSYDRQRSHDIITHSRRRADQHKISHRRQGLVESDYHSDGFLLGVEIGSQQLNNLLFFFQGLEQLLQALTIFLT